MADPKKPPTYPLRLSSTLYAKIKSRAEDEDRSMNYIIVRTLKREFGEDDASPISSQTGQEQKE